MSFLILAASAGVKLIMTFWPISSGNSASRSAASSRSSSATMSFISSSLRKSKISARMASFTFSRTSAESGLSSTSKIVRLCSLSRSSTTSAISLLRCWLSEWPRAELSPASSRISICCNSIRCTNCFCSSGIELPLRQ